MGSERRSPHFRPLDCDRPWHNLEIGLVATRCVAANTVTTGFVEPIISDHPRHDRTFSCLPATPDRNGRPHGAAPYPRTSERTRSPVASPHSTNVAPRAKVTPLLLRPPVW